MPLRAQSGPTEINFGRGERASSRDVDPVWHYGFLFSPALTVGGGTFAVQRNIVAEQVLGLPREVDVERGLTVGDPSTLLRRRLTRTHALTWGAAGAAVTASAGTRSATRVDEQQPLAVDAREEVGGGDRAGGAGVDEVLLRRHPCQVAGDGDRLVGEDELVTAGPAKMRCHDCSIAPTSQDRPAGVDAGRAIGVLPDRAAWRRCSVPRGQRERLFADAARLGSVSDRHV